MDIDIVSIPEVVKLAWNRLWARGRLSPSPARFSLVGDTWRGKRTQRYLDTSGPYHPVWRWPVLDLKASVGALVVELAAMQTDEDFESLCLVLEQDEDYKEEIFNFSVNHLARDYGPSIHKKILSIGSDDIERIMGLELAQGYCMAVVAQDIEMSPPEEGLPAHMVYAMDGTDDRLWIGALVENEGGPEQLKAATEMVSSVTGFTQDLLVVAGRIVDIGNGWAIVRNPCPIAMPCLKDLIR